MQPGLFFSIELPRQQLPGWRDLARLPHIRFFAPGRTRESIRPAATYLMIRARDGAPLKIVLHGFASIISSRQPPDDVAQYRVLHLVRRLRGREPLNDAFLFFRPLFVLAPDLQWKDAHFADDHAPILH